MEQTPRVFLLDVLMQIRHDVQRGRIQMYIGAVDANVFEGFVTGYRACLGDNGANDLEAAEFYEWLRVDKKEFPAEGWVYKYLVDCRGDHLAAIVKFLDFVAEFRGRKAS